LSLFVLGRERQSEAVAQAALAEAEQNADGVAAGYALLALAWHRVRGRDQPGRIASYERALDAVGADVEATDLRLMLLDGYGQALYDNDQLAESRQTIREALRLAEHAALPRQASVRVTAAQLWFEDGSWDHALAELTDVNPPLAAYWLIIHGIRALVAMHRDEPETAAEAMREVGGDLAPGSFGGEWVELRIAARALAAERAGDPGRVLGELAPLLDPAVEAEYFIRYQLLPTAVRAALAVGDMAAARAVAADSAAEAERGGTPSMRAAAEQCRGLLGGDGGVLRAAGEVFAGVGRPLLAGQAFEDAAVAYAQGGDDGEARAALKAALACYAGLGASYDARRAKARLRPYGLRPVQREPQRRPDAGWAALTPAEVQVADLLRSGKSNPDIAAELFLSRRTVESHVSRILTKLGAKSRLEVIAAIRPAEPDKPPP
jgi:DNA-binding CsgD family transcriptional regulator